MLELMSYSALRRVTDHVYWLPPTDPDRPSLAAVVGKTRTLMLDIGASPTHTRLFLEQLESADVPTPHFALLSHWHWDHVFGIAALEMPVLAHTQTAKGLEVLRGYSWSDEALDARVQSGHEAEMCARDIKLELPSPRTITLRAPDIVFSGGLTLDLGETTCYVLHVGGDHAEDACVTLIQPDRLVFLGDCLYEAIYAPERYYTPAKIFPLLETVLALEADHYITGHGGEVISRRELQNLARDLYTASTLVTRFGDDHAAMMQAASASGRPVDALAYNLELFCAGRKRSEAEVG